MSVIETAAVLSDVEVGNNKIINTLQKHIKAMFNGQAIFCLMFLLIAYQK